MILDLDGKALTFGARVFAGCWTAISLAVFSVSCHGTTAPSCKDYEGRGETSFNSLQLQCTTEGSALECTASAAITGLYVYCPKWQDVTAVALWSVQDTRVVQPAGSGIFISAGSGDTLIKAIWRYNSVDLAATQTVASFNGGPPAATYEITGRISEAGKPAATSPINDALVQVVDGPAAGRSTLSGRAPSPLPGYSAGGLVAGLYRLQGIPSGPYTLEVSKPGFVTQRHTVGASTSGYFGDFQLIAAP